MIELRSFVVRSFDLDHLDLFWEFNNTAQRVDRFSIFLERSVDGPAGPWRQIVGPFFNTGQFRDGDINKFHNHRAYFYRLRVLDKDSGEETFLGPATQEAEPDLYAIELRRRFELAMQEYGGRRVIVFPAITSGFRCTHCMPVNDKGMGSQRKLTQNCPTCWDTTFVGGYATPISAWMQIDPNPKNVVRTDTFERTPEDTSARCSSFPPLKPKDMIVEAENMRWEVQSVPTTKKGRAVVHQEPVLHGIVRSDVRYKVPINVELLQQFGPPREFTRPMDLPDEDESGIDHLGAFLDRLGGYDGS